MENNTVLSSLPTEKSVLADVVTIMDDLALVDQNTRQVYVAEGTLLLKNGSSEVVGVIRVKDDGDTLEFAPGIIK